MSLGSGSEAVPSHRGSPAIKKLRDDVPSGVKSDARGLPSAPGTETYMVIYRNGIASRSTPRFNERRIPQEVVLHGTLLRGRIVTGLDAEPIGTFQNMSFLFCGEDMGYFPKHSKLGEDTMIRTGGAPSMGSPSINTDVPAVDSAVPLTPTTEAEWTTVKGSEKAKSPGARGGSA